MTDTNVFQLSQPGTFTDPLTDVLRNSARALLAQAVEAEVSSLLSSHADKLTDDGRRRLVRHGHLPEREIMTSIGPVAVRCPRVRDRAFLLARSTLPSSVARLLHTAGFRQHRSHIPYLCTAQRPHPRVNLTRCVAPNAQ